MISEKKYLEALDTIKLYREQIVKQVNLTINGSERTEITDWIETNKRSLSTRAINSLSYISGNTYAAYIKPENYVKFLEDLSWDKFSKMRGAGKGSWVEILVLLNLNQSPFVFIYSIDEMIKHQTKK